MKTNNIDSWQDKFLSLDWQRYTHEAYELSQKIATQQKELHLIIAIARGGLTLSHIISDTLQLPIAAFTIESYKDLKQGSLPHITHGLTTSLAHKKILLVDEISDTGKTFVRGIAYLEELGAHRADITTCALYIKPHTHYKPDFFIGETTAWVIYPTEVRETISTLSLLWKKDGIDSEAIKKRLTTLGFSALQIASFTA